MSINLQGGTATGDASVGSDTFTGVYSVMGSNFADVYNATNFTGISFGTYNEFQGFAGNDVITGNGNTQIQYFGATAGVTVDMQAGTAIGDTSVDQDTFTGVNSVAGSNFNDALYGDGGTDLLSGFGGNDLIDGRGGNDVLTGGTGADRFVYADGYGADIITDFNRTEGDVMDVTGVSGIFTFSDIQSRATVISGNTVIDFGGGNTLTLSGVTSVQQSDFVFNGPITGTPGPDVLLGTSQADAIFGLAGNDRLQGFAGNDQLDGGLGFDRAVYLDATGGVTVNLAAGTASGAGVGTDTLVGIEGAVGSDFADTFNAAGFTGDTLTPGTPIGFNEFEGRGGNDLVIGLTSSQGALLTRVSYVNATAGVSVNFASGTADGDASVGHDTFVGAGVANVSGSAFADVLTGGNNPNGTVETFDGRAGNDIINGGGGFDRADYNLDPLVTTGIKVDLAIGQVSPLNPLDLTTGIDTLRSVEAVRGTNFDDIYDATGFSGSSINAGSLGTFNEFTGVGGNDTIIGNGNTRLSFNGATASVSFDIVLGTAVGADASIGTDHFSGVNAIQATMFNDTLRGSGTNENFAGLAGDDFIDGRGGFDTATYNNIYFTTGAINVNMATGDVFGDISSGHDTLRSIEAIQGTNFADTYVATNFGASGLDPNLFNVGNNGTFNQFEGLAGNDSTTGNGNTRLLYASATGGVSINLQGGIATGDASVGTDTFTGVNSASGSNFNDTYTAIGFVGINGAFNAFLGQGGNDTITGNGNTQIQYNNATGGVTFHMAAGTAAGDASVGNDNFSGVYSVTGGNFADDYDATNFTGLSLGTYNEFQGQGGDDTIAGNGNTQIRFDNATAGVTVDLATGNASGDASVGHDTFTGVNSVFGSNLDDIIWGSSANEFLNGGNGNDTLNGLGGNDTLAGGGGADTFDYADGGGADTITDFNRAQGDTIDVRGVSGILTFADIQSKATLSAGNTVINFGGGNTLTLTAVTSLLQSDFIFPTSFPTNGTSSADALLGTSQADTISGLDGNDVIKGLQGNDFIDGGSGRDVSDYSDATGSIYVDLTLGVVSGDASVGADTLRSIEYIRGTNFSDTYFAVGYQTPSPVSPLDIPIISSVSNTFEGGGGNDVIFGSAGTQASYSTGFAGTQISYADALDGVTVDLLAGTAHGTAANDVANVGTDTFTGVNAIIGSDFNDTLLGSNTLTHTDVFYGGKGDDFIDGRAGYDFITYTSFLNPTSVTGGILVNLAAGVVTGIRRLVPIRCDRSSWFVARSSTMSTTPPISVRSNF